MSEVFNVLSIAVFAVFVVVILSGIISGLVALGLVELWARPVIQKWIISSFVRRRLVRAADTKSSDEVLRRPYLDQTAPYDPDDDKIRIANELRERPENALAYAVGMEPHQFLSLHHRQLCGALVASIGREATRGTVLPQPAPTLDLLLRLSPQFAMDRSRSVYEPVDPNIRGQVDQATAVVDSLQAELARLVLMAAFWSAFSVWAFMFSVVVTPTIFSFRGVFQALFEGAVYVVVALPACLILAFAAAVVGTLLFAWLDRVFSVR